MLTFQALRNANLARDHEYWRELGIWTCSDWGNAMAGEAGEACNAIKHLRQGKGSVDDIMAELADTVIYADLIAAHFGRDLGAAVVEKFNRISDKIGAKAKL